jgi:phosphotransferase system IIB component
MLELRESGSVAYADVKRLQLTVHRPPLSQGAAMSFQQGLSGLNATSKNLEVIGNNVANSQHLRRQGGRVPSSPTCTPTR